ncbi:hypothetical protein ACO1KS_14150, partial [Staphylococcus aureus]
MEIEREARNQRSRSEESRDERSRRRPSTPVVVAVEQTLQAHQQLQADFARAMARAEQQEAQAQALFALSQSVSVTQEPDDLR